MDPAEVSVVLPVYLQADHIRDVVAGLDRALAGFSRRVELILVPNGPDRDGTLAACRDLAERFPRVRCVPAPGSGGGLAVRTGLAAARGDLLAFANSARLTPTDLLAALALAERNPGAVVKACRIGRESPLRRLGSWLYNMECRLLLGTHDGDVNGTPKVIPREHLAGLGLGADGPLIHLEFMVGCRRQGLGIVPLPILPAARNGGESTTGLATAARLYLGAARLWASGSAG